MGKRFLYVQAVVTPTSLFDPAQRAEFRGVARDAGGLSPEQIRFYSVMVEVTEEVRSKYNVEAVKGFEYSDEELGYMLGQRYTLTHEEEFPLEDGEVMNDFVAEVG